MRRSQVIPKICAAAVFLIIAIVISAPVASVFLNKIFGGGTVEFGGAGVAEYLQNRPVEGVLGYIIGCASDNGDDDSFTLKSSAYYYLVPVDGINVKNDKSQNVLLLKTLGNSKSYEELNEKYRSGAGSDNNIVISGVAKKVSENERQLENKICEENNLSEVTCIEYYVDCTKPVSSFTARFLLSLIFYAGCIISILLSVQAVKKNRDFDYMEHRREIMKAAGKVKSENGDSNDTDSMFGDSDRSYASAGTQQQGSGQSPVEVARELEQQPQFQNAQQPQFSNDDGFFGQQNNSEDKYDGFFGS